MLPLNKEEREIPRLPRLFAVDIASLALMTLHSCPSPLQQATTRATTSGGYFSG